MRFETGEFTRSTKSFGSMDSLFVRATAGEEVFVDQDQQGYEDRKAMLEGRADELYLPEIFG